jgi:hypothetical protein
MILPIFDVFYRLYLLSYTIIRSLFYDKDMIAVDSPSIYIFWQDFGEIRLLADSLLSIYE